MCCQVGESVTGRSPVQRTPTECGVPECDLETLMMRRPRPTTVVESGGGRGVESKSSATDMVREIRKCYSMIINNCQAFEIIPKVIYAK